MAQEFWGKQRWCDASEVDTDAWTAKQNRRRKKKGGGNTVGLPYSDLDQNLEGTAFSNHDLFIINKKGVLINIFLKFETKFLLYIKFRK